MKEKLDLKNYSVQEMTIMEAQETNGGWGVLTRPNPLAAMVKFVSETISLFESAYIQGRRNSGCTCF